MDRIDRILILILTLIQNISCQQYEIRASADECVFATPTITYSKDGNFIDLPTNIGDAIQEGEQVRVGYQYTFGAFQYIGCIWYDDLPDNTPSKELHADPGQCYSYCRSEYFAVYDARCYCLKNEISDTHDNCNKACKFPSNTACGGDGFRGFYPSVYRYVNSDKSGKDDGRYCLAYNTVTKSFEWGDCEFRLYGLCQTDLDDPYSWTSRDKNWRTYTISCFSDDVYPAYENISRYTGSPHQWLLWLGVIRSFVVTRVNEDIDVALNYRGYVKKTSDIFLIEFQKEDPSTPFRQLCLKGHLSNSDHSSTPTSVRTTTAATTIPSHMTTKILHSNLTTTLSTTESATKNVTANKETYKQEASQQNCKALIAVYIVVPVCLLFCVAVLILYIISKLRIKSLEEKVNHNQNDDRLTSTNSNVNTGRTTIAVEDDFSKKTVSDSALNYFILEPQDTYSQIEKKTGPKITENNDSESDYDTTVTLQRKNRENNNDTIYNRLGDESLDVYSHSNEIALQDRFRNDEQTYNHVEKDGAFTDSYNSLNELHKNQDSRQLSNNVYSNTLRH